MKNVFNKNIVLVAAMFSSCIAFADQSTTYTYNNNGQILTEDGPRTDVTDVKTYTYDTSGNRATFTNGLSHVVRYNSYDGAGHLLSLTDANGITTEFTYHDRGWLLTSKIKHPTNYTLDSETKYGYDAVGQMTSITLPNGYVFGLEYDDARRLKVIKNPAGERIEYTLDAAGNRTQQIVKNNAGTIVYSVAQAFDELSRVMSVTGNHSQTIKQQYDANDNTTAVIDGRNNKTQQTYDALNRVAKVIDPKLKETKFTYDTQDRIKTVTDARGNVTTYNYDGFGNLLSLVSPDTGTTTFTYDTAGNRTSATDARGVVVNYTYDALNRLKTVTYSASSSENVTYTYDSTANSSYGIGRLSSVVTGSIRNDYVYNYQGLIVKKFTQIDSSLATIQYSYDTAGNLLSITYPSGRSVIYTRDAEGRIQSISTKANANATAQSIASAITYLPFGPVASYTYGNGFTHTNTFDTDYRLTAIQVGGVLSRGYTYDLADNITGISDGKASSKNQTLEYDELDRLTSAQGIYGTLGYTYDSVGNRLTETAAGTTATYTYETTSNRLSSIAKTNANRSFLYDVAGNRIKGTSDALKVQDYTYNNANRLSTVKDTGSLVATYKYNALGQRVSKLLASQVQELYHYDEAGHLIAVTDASGNSIREYIYSGDELLGFVSGSSTAIPTTTVTATTNQATLQNAVLSKTYSGYSGSSGYIQFNGEGQASWPVTVATTANHTIQISYALASGTRPMDLYVDGVKKTTVNFASTNAWTKWTATSLTLNLTAGNHTFMLKTTGTSGPNLDRIRFTPVAGQTTGTASLYYVHNDHKSTPQIVTAQNQSVVWMADYQPFGKLQPNQSNSLELYSRFPGQYVDNETGIYYNYFRDYDPSIGRYIESDPIGLLRNYEEPQLQISIDLGALEETDFANEVLNHTYGYVGQNPQYWFDPFGLAEHQSGARPSTKEKHENANARRDKDRGGEKGDKNRAPPRKPPPGYKGKWPPVLLPIPFIPSEILEKAMDPCFPVDQGEACMKKRQQEFCDKYAT